MSFLGYAACPDCGIAMPLADAIVHECKHAHWMAFQVAKARAEIQGFDAEFASYLESPRGRFDAWYAERTRRAARAQTVGRCLAAGPRASTITSDAVEAAKRDGG